MSRQRTVTQIDANARHLLAGFEACGRLQRLVEAGLVEARGERKGRYYDVPPNNMGATKSDMGTPVSAPIKPTRPSRPGQRGKRP